ncbi:S8 family serine peptidase [Plantactinospora sp. KBS50]|uniref:S8 family serine peptidase n=1 Tax=Plantactinospora sp. KBS50 TaxID=2024580 RepID=UPI000BAAB6A1|nr:S8 family serine peptidase [Plantactinospora sp. KBS50]ASW56674.1 serine protease [Plantactinospora sp. KBS50]
MKDASHPPHVDGASSGGRDGDQPPNWTRRACAGLLTSVLAVGAAALAGGASASADPANDPDTLKDSPARTLGAHDMDLLATAKAKRQKTVMLIIATDKGRAREVASGLAKLGGTVGKEVDAVGYVRAQVPTAAVLKAAKLPGVTAVDLDETIPLPKPEPVTAADGSAGTVAVDAPGPDTPAANPYLPTNETGAVSFKRAHPEWDGRGVTIGIMDSGVDLDNPALQTTSTGERKIVDWFTATDPIYDGDGTWRAMLTEVTGPTFSYAGATWTAPAGTWRVNRFSESITAGGDPGGDVNRDGDTTDTFGILYDPVSHDIRVDTNQNNDFTDDAVMRPYRERYDVGHFGTDDPATPLREQMPFTVEYRQDVDLSPYGGPYVGQTTDFVNIGIVEAQHGSHVAGITAAYNMFGNAEFNGAAPGAKLVSARACSWSGGCTYAALTDGMVELVVNRHVDVVNMSIGGLPALNDANNARAQLYDRLIDDYGVQMFISAGNSGPGVNTVGDPSVATNVVSVAAGISRATWLANYGSVTRTPYQLFNFSSRGPREDGGFKPNITAPGSAISTTPLWQAGAPVPDAGYSLPPGYSMLNGTSMAAPEATGAAALLLSAAKATDRGVTPAALRRAIYSSARWIDGAPAYGQGYGQFNVPGAWALLRTGIETRTYTSQAPVCTPLSDYLATPGKGTGIYNRCSAGAGGQRPGVAKTYTVKITRTSGPTRTVKHDLSWVGNDGTFKAPKHVALPLNKTVKIQVTAKGDAGAHGAILRVDDPATPAVDFEVMASVVIGNQVKRPDFAYSAAGSVDRNLTRSYFVTVPEGAAALQVNLSGIATGSQTRFIAINPYGVPVESTASTACFTNYSDANVCNPQERDYQNPLPGIWEIEVEARRTSPALNNPFQLTARVQGVTVDPAVLDLPSVTAGEPTPVTWTVTNAFGPVTVHGEGGPLGSSAAGRPSIADGETQTFQVTVPAGATRLDIGIKNPSDPSADLDLYVRRDGVEVGRSADGDSDESVSIANPAPGTYEIEIDGYSVPAGTTEYDYRDVFYSPSLGSVSVSPSTVTLGYGDSATISGTVTADAAPESGRQLFGEVRVVTDEGAVVGRGAVTIGSVG